jgi:hypothetical protein
VMFYCCTVLLLYCCALVLLCFHWNSRSITWTHFLFIFLVSWTILATVSFCSLATCLLCQSKLTCNLHPLLAV